MKNYLIGECDMIIDLNEPLYSYNKFIEDAQALAKQYNEIVKYVTIGKSHDNRDIVLLKLGSGKRYIVCCGGVHGRETINTIVLMKIIEYYAQLYLNYKSMKAAGKLRPQSISYADIPIQPNHSVNQSKVIISSEDILRDEYEQAIYGNCIYELLQTYTILFIPLLNPDGYMISLLGYDCIDNKDLRNKCITMNIRNSEWKFNARGIDINRNFPSRLWKPSNDMDYVASETETKSLVMVFHQYKPKGFLDFHSRGRSIYYYKRMMSKTYNDRQLSIASQLKNITGYELVHPKEEVEHGDSGGNTVHYFSEHFYKTAFTIETVEDEAPFPLDINYRHMTFEELKLVIFTYGSLII